MELLSDGKAVIFVLKIKNILVKKTKTPHEEKIINLALNDKNVVAILTASNSYDGFRELLSLAKNKSVNEVIKNYKKYFIYPYPEWGSKGFLI